MNIAGVFIGIMAFLLIGVFHPIVIKSEYYFGKGVWPCFLGAGLFFIVLALFIKSDTISAIVAIVGFSCLWSIHEIIEQEKRVEKGWFPKNPNKKKKQER